MSDETQETAQPAEKPADARSVDELAKLACELGGIKHAVYAATDAAERAQLAALIQDGKPIADFRTEVAAICAEFYAKRKASSDD